MSEIVTQRNCLGYPDQEIPTSNLDDELHEFMSSDLTTLDNEDNIQQLENPVSEQEIQINHLLDDIVEDGEINSDLAKLDDEDNIQQQSEMPIAEREIPISLLVDDIVTDDEIQFMNSELATLEDIGNILEIIKSKEIKRLAFGCKKSFVILKVDVNTLSKAREEENKVIFTAFVLEQVCEVIGSKVRRSLEELFLHNLPITMSVSMLNIHRARYLKKLSLRHCQLNDYGCKTIFKHLSTSISHIDLTDNNITKRGIYFIADAIREQNATNFVHPTYTGIQYLCLNYNPIRSEGLAILLEVILSDFCLKSVELRNCDIEDVGETYILAMVNTGLEVFDLRQNPIREKKKVNEITKLLIQNNPQEKATFKWSKVDKLFMD